MVSFTSALIALGICIVGVGYTSYRIGIQKGADAVVQHLLDEGIIKLEDDGTGE